MRQGKEDNRQNRYLLLDARIIQSSLNAELVLGKVVKHPMNPLFEEDRAWEKRYDNLYANVLWDSDDNIYKCWYSPFIISKSSKNMAVKERIKNKYGKHSQEMGICYAVSRNGLIWDKPNLGLVE